MEPLSLALLFSSIIGGGAAAASAAGQAGAQRSQDWRIASMDDNTRQLMARMENNRQRESDAQRIAFGESMANPYRHQMSQGDSASRLHFLQRAKYEPRKYSGGYGTGQPLTKTGGFSFTPSAGYRRGMGALYKDVMAGNTAPSVAGRPENLGQTAALDLTGPMAGTGPATPAQGPAPLSRRDLQDPLALGGWNSGAPRITAQQRQEYEQFLEEERRRREES